MLKCKGLSSRDRSENCLMSSSENVLVHSAVKPTDIFRESSLAELMLTTGHRKSLEDAAILPFIVGASFAVVRTNQIHTSIPEVTAIKGNNFWLAPPPPSPSCSRSTSYCVCAVSSVSRRMAEEPQPEVISDKLLLDAAWERQQKKVCLTILTQQ